MPDPQTAPSPPTATPEQEVRTRQRLLQAGVQIFDRKGYAAASVREIADAAGVTKPVLYYYFGSKEGLLVAILNEATQDFRATLEASVVGTGPARARIVQLCEGIYGLFERHVPVARVAHGVFFGPRDGAPPFDLMVFERLLRGAIVPIVIEGQRSGELRATPPADVALAIMSILEGATDRQMLPELNQVGRDGLRRILNLLFDGLATAGASQGEFSK